jgi:hypothetical protein
VPPNATAGEKKETPLLGAGLLVVQVSRSTEVYTEDQCILIKRKNRDV